MKAVQRTMENGFLRSAAAFPERTALEVDGQSLSYADLEERARSLAAALDAESPGSPHRTAVFAYRTVPAFSGVLAALLRGHAYVPLNRTFPPDRTRAMLERSGCRAIVADAQSALQLPGVLDGLDGRFVIVLPEEDDISGVAAALSAHRVLGRADVAAAGAPERRAAWKPRAARPDDLVYILFTSGSTGSPKGVMVAHRNVAHFVDVMTERYGISENDRFSQMFDQTFDLSAFDMFVCWDRGACLCCPTPKQLLQPGGFIRNAGLTVWFSVPSTGVFMKKLGALKPDRYPTLRWSLFCGEALPAEIARAWSAAAPASTVENLYGPTEVTIACMLYRWHEDSDSECVFDIVPIGEAYPGMTYLVGDEEQRPVPAGGEGELLLSGPQVTPGYLDDPERTAAAFVTPPGRQEVFYRTGDRVRAPADGQPCVYLGRMDHQVKIRGHRVELGEIECALRDESGVDGAIALAWPMTVGGASGIVAFLQTESADVEGLRRKLESRLPDYMLPREIRTLPRFPLNANGKFDRKAMAALLEETP